MSSRSVRASTLIRRRRKRCGRSPRTRSLGRVVSVAHLAPIRLSPGRRVRRGVLVVTARTRPSPAPLVLTPPCRVRRERLAVTVRTAPRAPQALTLLSPALQDRRGRPGKMARTPPSLVPQDRQDQQARTAATVAVSRPSPAKSQAHGSSRTQTEQRAVPPGRARPSPLHHQENPLATEAQVR